MKCNIIQSWPPMGKPAANPATTILRLRFEDMKCYFAVLRSDAVSLDMA